MANLTFDTLKFVKTLESAGVPAQQAEAISTAVRDAHDATDIATKADLALLRKDIIIKLGGMLMAGFSLTIALLLNNPQ